MRFIATCKIGLESVVSLELRRLGIEVERVEDARVLFLGDYQTMAKACLWLRTAERVLMEVASFEARSFEELFQGVKAVSWRDYLKKDSFIHVNGKSAKSTLFSVSDCQRIAKKAIVENLMAAYRTDRQSDRYAVFLFYSGPFCSRDQSGSAGIYIPTVFPGTAERTGRRGCHRRMRLFQNLYPGNSA